MAPLAQLLTYSHDGTTSSLTYSHDGATSSLTYSHDGATNSISKKNCTLIVLPTDASNVLKLKMGKHFQNHSLNNDRCLTITDY